MRIGFIGGGNMAEAIIKGILSQTSQTTKDIVVSEPREKRKYYLHQHYGLETTKSNKDVVSSCNIIILAVKPQDMATVLDEISASITEEKTVISIAAGIPLSNISLKLKTKKLIRAMPNTPALVQEGMTVMSLFECFPDEEIGPIKNIFMSVGQVLVLPEKYMDAVTALSGSGPAFLAFFIEAMVEGGISIGLKKEDAVELAVQTALGTSKLLHAGMSPSALKEKVTSPGGTTAAGLKVFEEKGLKNIVIEAIKSAADRAKEMGNK
ncbi:MAG: pyrroline-5-carboxylate reductase [Candidatus Mariimomonas ferrooxydans]